MAKGVTPLPLLMTGRWSLGSCYGGCCGRHRQCHLAHGLKLVSRPRRHKRNLPPPRPTDYKVATPDKRVFPQHYVTRTGAGTSSNIAAADRTPSTGATPFAHRKALHSMNAAAQGFSVLLPTRPGASKQSGLVELGAVTTRG